MSAKKVWEAGEVRLNHLNDPVDYGSATALTRLGVLGGWGWALRCFLLQLFNRLCTCARSWGGAGWLRRGCPVMSLCSCGVAGHTTGAHTLPHLPHRA